jgi:hypothetical protein
VLAYVFWHRPREDSALEAYERAELAFHHSLARARPAGLRGTALFRVAELPWLPQAPAVAAGVPAAMAGAPAAMAGVPAVAAGVPAATAGAPAAGAGRESGREPGYEDWYLVEDFTALGILNEAAVGHGHRTVHDDVARRFGSGAGGLYGLIEGELGPGVDSIGESSVAVWVARTPGTERRALGELLGDGMRPDHASLWRRQLVFGPAPEFCLLASEPPPGVAPARLPVGWSATALAREALWHG